MGRGTTAAARSFCIRPRPSCYGDGVFEGIRAYGGRVFRLDAHLDRLYASAKAIWLEIPMSKDVMGRMVRGRRWEERDQDNYIRLVVTRGVGDLGLDPRKCAKPTIFCIFDTIKLWPQDRYEKGLTALTAATPIHHREAFRARQVAEYLSHILAKSKASRECGRGDHARCRGYVAERAA